MTSLVAILYIVAFSLFIYGLSGLTGPRTAVRGNRIAAIGMAVAIVATLLLPGMGQWVLIIVGLLAFELQLIDGAILRIQIVSPPLVNRLV